MHNNIKKHRMVNLTSSEIAVLDQLLAEYPAYAMVDDYIAVRKLLANEMIEPNVRIDGDADQPVYRITDKGATAYAWHGMADALERVS